MSILPLIAALGASYGRGVPLPSQRNHRGQCPKCGGEAKMISERAGERLYRCKSCGVELKEVKETKK